MLAKILQVLVQLVLPLIEQWILVQHRILIRLLDPVLSLVQLILLLLQLLQLVALNLVMGIIQLLIDQISILIDLLIHLIVVLDCLLVEILTQLLLVVLLNLDLISDLILHGMGTTTLIAGLTSPGCLNGVSRAAWIVSISVIVLRIIAAKGRPLIENCRDAQQQCCYPK